MEQTTIRELLTRRFGTSSDFEDKFLERGSTLRLKFDILLTSYKSRKFEQHEILRQQWLKVLGRQQNVWRQTNTKYDENIDICRLYASRNCCEFLAFMRVGPGGFKANQRLERGSEIVFHLIQGSVQFFYKSKCKVLTKGCTVTVKDEAPYSIKSLTYDQCSYIIFKASDASKKVIYVDDDSTDF